MDLPELQGGEKARDKNGKGLEKEIKKHGSGFGPGTTPPTKVLAKVAVAIRGRAKMLNIFRALGVIMVADVIEIGTL